MSSLWQSVSLSLEIAGSATLVVCILAIPLAFVMARWRFPAKHVVEAFIMVPLVLPPTVVGYLILMLIGGKGAVGAWLLRHFNYSIIFRVEGAILAAVVVALPMLYMPAKAAFQSVDRELEDVSRLLGANRLQMFWHVSLPLARRGILSGLILAFARALGEFGATVMVFGWRPAHLTLPISIYADYDNNELASATPAVVALLILSLSLMIGYNHFSRPSRD